MRKNKKAKNKGKGPLRLQNTDDAEQQLETNRLTLRQRQELTPEGSGSALARSSENRSSDRFSGAFFEGANGVDISGGTFEQTHGHRNNVTIHLNVNSSFPGQNSGGPSQQPRPSSSHSSTSSHSGSSTFTSPPVYGQSTSSSLQDLPPKKNNEIYKEQLLLQKRGIPLWIPEPNMNLPMSYRRIGVTLGDVGIYTPSGDFSFLFNICLPRNHPIQPNNLPQGFVPLDPSIGQIESQKLSELKAGSHLNSKNIKTTQSHYSTVHGLTCLTFETTAAECAILTIPEGAITHVLENVSRVQAYVAENIESWYRYVNGPACGREVKNGEIRLVIRCDKATSWGMAVISCQDERTLHHLSYRPIECHSNASLPSRIRLYDWDYSAFAEARVGPDLEEIEELRRDDDSDAAVTGKYSNQCLFMHTLNPTLDGDIFASISKGLRLETALGTETWPSSTKTSSLGTSASNKRKSPSRNEQAHGQSMASEPQITGSVAKKHVVMSTSQIAKISHPADILNKPILEKMPGCRVVITQDEDWCSVIEENDEVMPNAAQIAERVLAVFEIKQENGIAFLERKKDISPVSTSLPYSLGRKNWDWIWDGIESQRNCPSSSGHSMSNKESTADSAYGRSNGSTPASSLPNSPPPSPCELDDPLQQTIQFTENYLRESMTIPKNQPLDLSALPDEPFGSKPPKISDMIKLAIWGSPNHKLTLRQIYAAIEEKYPSWKDAEDKSWQRSIRHNLSLKAMFVRTERPPSDPGVGYYWTLDLAHGDGNKRDRATSARNSGMKTAPRHHLDGIYSNSEPLGGEVPFTQVDAHTPGMEMLVHWPASIDPPHGMLFQHQRP